jgi:cytochrome P450
VKTLDDAPFLDIFDAEFQADPAPFVDAARRESWLARTAIGGLVLDREQVQALLADRHLRSSIVEFIEMQGVTDGVLHERLRVSLLASDGADNTRLRKLVSRAFTPRAVDPHRALMRDILVALVDPVLPAGRCEFMSAISDHYPIQVMCHMLGVPVEDHEEFATWNDAITWALSFELAAHREEAEWGMKHMDSYVAGLVAQRRREPCDDLVTALAQAEEEGDRLSDDELLSMIGGLLFAGYDTTRNQLGLAMWLFAEHPEQWALLAENPDLAPRAVEEVMRMRGAIDVAPRVVAEDFEFDGYRLTAGTLLSLGTANANHDPAVFDRPETFDITLEREPQLTFGGGPHYCLGANLARAEMQEALPILAARMPDLRLDGEPTWRPPFGIFGPQTLPVRFSPSSS